MTRLKELREAHLLTQEQCAKIGYISKKTYERYEKNERTIPIDTAVFFAKFYNVTLDYIAGIDQTLPPTTEPSELKKELLIKEITPALLNAVSKLSKKQQLTLAEFLNSK